MSKRILWWIGALVFGGVVILINSNSAQWVFLGHLFVPSLGWMLLVLVMIGINARTAFAATDPKIRDQMVYGLISGFLVGVGAWLFLDFVVAREIPLLLDKAGTVSPLIQVCFDWVKSTMSALAGILPPWLRSGYFRVDGNVWVIEPGHVRAAVCFLATTLLYFWLKTKQLTPLCYVLLLITVLVWGLSGLSFFLDAFRISLFVPIVFWLSVAAFHPKADHFYRIHNEVSETGDKYLRPLDPASVLTSATENDDRIILVIHKKKGPPFSWHLRTEEQAEIDHAWTSIRTGEQTQKVLAYLGLGKSKRAFITAH
jgi:hypothetical protein